MNNLFRVMNIGLSPFSSSRLLPVFLPWVQFGCTMDVKSDLKRAFPTGRETQWSERSAWNAKALGSNPTFSLSNKTCLCSLPFNSRCAGVGCLNEAQPFSKSMHIHVFPKLYSFSYRLCHSNGFELDMEGLSLVAVCASRLIFPGPWSLGVL